MTQPRLPFIDWLKCLGMLMIVYGHASAGTDLFATDPVHSKQLGVAFFVFATAVGLAATAGLASAPSRLG